MMHSRDWVAAVMILLLASALRFGGIAFGQPIAEYAPEDAALQSIHENTPLHPDEFLFIQRPLRMLLTGQLNPKFFHNPSFLINTNLVVFWLTGEQNRLDWSGREEIGARRAAPFRLYVTGRTFSALGGVLAVAAVYGAGRMLAGRNGAILSSLLVAVSLPMVQHAHYTTTSSLAAGFVGVCIWASFASLRGHFRWWMFAMAGATAGLAAGNRYNAAAVSLIVFFAGLVLIYRQRTVKRLMSVLFGWIMFPTVFLFTTPHIIFDTAFVWDEFRFITNQYIGDEESPLNVSEWVGLWYEYRYLILYGTGLPGSALVLFGLWRSLTVRGWNLLQRASDSLSVGLLLVYLLPYSYVVLRTIRPLGADQMLVPVIPAFALIAGLGYSTIIDRFAIKKWLWQTILLLVIAGYPLMASAQVTWQFMRVDNRYLVQAWAYENIPFGSRVHLDGPYNVPLDNTLYEWTQTYGGGNLPDIESLRVDGFDYVIVSDAWYQHFRRAGYVARADVAQVQAHLAAYEANLPVVFRVERPRLLGMRDAMHSASYWHQPALTVYCLTDEACSRHN